jgi:heterodisulfide reductase subunit B
MRGKTEMGGRAKVKAYGYYPGCSAHATAQEYEASVLAVFKALGLALTEIEGWNCCGASSAHNLSHNLAIGLPGRNLALIEESGLQTVAPCAACFNRLRAAQEEIRTHPEETAWLAEALDAPLKGTAVVRSAISVVMHDVGLARITAAVKKPLRNLKVVTYYGCLLARPKAISDLSDSEHPHELEILMQALGAQPLQWSHAVDCCGGGLSIARPDIAVRMTDAIADAARATGAEVLITACPMCQMNLEMRQSEKAGARMPAIYFTEAMGLAFDLPETTRWWKKHLIDPRPVLKRLELL